MEVIKELFATLSHADLIFFFLLIILVSLVIVLEALSTIARKKQKAAGVTPQIDLVLSPSSNFKETKTYVSDLQLLAGKPDALLVESGYVIPVERKPYTNKVRDRYIAQLLVYMRLIEEFEGKKPPYAYLILGKNARRVKVTNTKKRQEWLDGLLSEMQSALAGEGAQAAPHIKKCARCRVAQYCEDKIQ